MQEPEIYDITDLVRSSDMPEKRIAAFSRLIRPGSKFYVIQILRAVKEGEKYSKQPIKILLCDEQARELLTAYFEGLVVEYMDGRFSIFFAPEIPADKLYQLQEDLHVEEDEVIVAIPVEENLYRLEKKKLSDLPIRPFPHISEEIMTEYSRIMAKEELERAKKEIERRHGVVLG